MRKILAAGVIALASMGTAHATTVDTFSFTQGGYAPTPYGPGTLTGTFSGVVETSGLINLADLQSFTITFTFPIDAMGTFEELFGYTPSLFSFNVPSMSDLELVVPIGLSNVACVGAVVGFDFGPCVAPPAPQIGNGEIGNESGRFYTADLPTFTLVSSVTTNPPPPKVPAPGGLAVAGVGLAALIGLRSVARARRPGIPAAG